MDTLNPGQNPPGTSLSILVVDDDSMVREVTSLMLADAGHVVHEAEDGVAALDLLHARGPVDLLITDVNMPRMDGLELARQAQAAWPGLPVLVVSGRPQPAGMHNFIAKPFGWDALMNALAQVVRLRPTSLCRC